MLDEADEMLSMGFLQDVRAILSRLPDQRQGLFVSATITPRVDMLVHSFLSQPEHIEVSSPEEEHPDIEHFYCEVGSDLMAKPLALCDLIETQRPRSTIIFCNTKSDTTLVEALLRRRGFDARRINSDLSQSQRSRIMKKIRADELKILVATDIAARGLDIEQIELVVNYAIHDQSETYVHRTGRTGRAGRSGRAVSLVGARDFGAFHHLQKMIDVEIKKLPLPTDEEVADARLAHLYEILREEKIEVKDRDLIVSKKLLKEMGEIENAPEELENILAKLSLATVEHFVQQEAKSLEEELDEAPKEKKEKREGKDRKERSKRDDKKSRREKDERNGNRRDDKRESRNERNEREDRRDSRGERKDKRKRDSRSDKRDDKRERKPREDETLRLYIGQGNIHGMDAASFIELAKEHTGLSKKDFKVISFRSHYGYVDLNKDHAKTLIEKVNGIEHNELQLPVEKACEIGSNQRKRRN